MRKPPDYWGKIAFIENINDGSISPYTQYLNEWKDRTNSFGVLRQQAIKILNIRPISIYLHRGTPHVLHPLPLVVLGILTFYGSL